MADPSLRTRRCNPQKERDQRNNFQRDRDRVLYTPLFRRLAGITQVAHAGEAYTYHNRLSHSLKVAQVGRRLTEYFLSDAGPDVPDGIELNEEVVETAALAHDIGHPPFGHVAEMELDRKIREEKEVHEGFEGNAQSFRVVTKVANHDEVERGLNLTLASLNAILKYPWSRGDEGDGDNHWGVNEYKKWGYYGSEEDVFNQVRKLADSDKKKSAEADIMDWADDVAYAVHDLSDFYKAGIIPLEQILTEQSKEREKFVKYLEEEAQIKEEPNKVLDFIDDISDANLRTGFTGSREDRRSLDYFVSTLIQRYMGVEKGGVRLQDVDVKPYLQIDENLRREVKILKEMTLYYAIQDQGLKAQQRGQRQIVSELFDIFHESLENSEDGIPSTIDILPKQFQEDAKELQNDFNKKRCVRLVADIITSMTEKQAIQMHDRLTGSSQGTIHERIVD